MPRAGNGAGIADRPRGHSDSRRTKPQDQQPQDNRKARAMVTAIVLIDVEADRITEAAQQIADLPGVDQVYSCAGDVDLVADHPGRRPRGDRRPGAGPHLQGGRACCARSPTSRSGSTPSATPTTRSRSACRPDKADAQLRLQPSEATGQWPTSTGIPVERRNCRAAHVGMGPVLHRRCHRAVREASRQFLARIVRRPRMTPSRPEAATVVGERTGVLQPGCIPHNLSTSS